MTPTSNARLSAGALILFMLGVGIILTELARHWLYGNEIEAGIIAIGCLFGFAGAFRSDKRGTIEGARFVIDAGLDVVAVVRTGTRAGRRSSDVLVITPVPKEEEENDATR